MCTVFLSEWLDALVVLCPWGVRSVVCSLAQVARMTVWSQKRPHSKLEAGSRLRRRSCMSSHALRQRVQAIVCVMLPMCSPLDVNAC
jgi:hypothetical protein